MLKRIGRTKSFKAFKATLWDDNAIFRMVLGMCSALAVTNQLTNTLAMSLGVIFTVCGSSVTISMIRKFIPRGVRMAVYTVVIATFVVFVDQYLKAFQPTISKQVGPYVGLIITNCIVMGRAEAFASSNPPWLSFWDGLGCSMGYSFSLISVGIIREILGFGTLLGYPIMGPAWEDWVIMVLAPGAFFVVGVYVWIMRTIQKGPK